MKTTNSIWNRSLNSVKMMTNEIQQFTQLHFHSGNNDCAESIAQADWISVGWNGLSYEIHIATMKEHSKICFLFPVNWILFCLDCFFSHQTLLRRNETKDFWWLFLYIFIWNFCCLARIDASKSSSHEETYQIRLSIASNGTKTATHHTLAHIYNVKS